MPDPTGEFGGSVDLTPAIPPAPLRDWAVLAAIRDALEATGAFDAVALGAEPEAQGLAASVGKLAVVAPMDWEEVDDADGIDAVDAVDDARNTVRLRFRLTIVVREGDVEARGSELDRLVGVAKNAIDGRALIPGGTIPGWTKLRRGTWQDPRSPEWRQVIVGETAYLVDGDDMHNEDEV